MIYACAAVRVWPTALKDVMGALVISVHVFSLTMTPIALLIVADSIIEV